jgi:hypothetical protein
MTPSPRPAPEIRRRIRLVARRPFLPTLAAAALASALLAPRALAEEGEGPGGETQDLQQKLEEQMKKIVRLMRENEAALLEASRGGSADPKAVDVRPPDGSAGSPPPSGTPPEGAPPPQRSEEIRRKMDELIRGSTERGRSIPKELEELVKMIPLTESNSPPQGGETPESEARRRREEQAKKPEDGEKRPQDGDPQRDKDPKTPPKEDKPTPPSDPARADVPPWLAELPDEVRRRVQAGDFEAVPAKYRKLVEEYLKTLNEQAGKTR